MPWKAWPPQEVQHQPWKQGLRGPAYGTMPDPSYPMQQQYTQYPTQNQFPPQF
jgi:hypothetical protein